MRQFSHQGKQQNTFDTEASERAHHRITVPSRNRSNPTFTVSPSGTLRGPSGIRLKIIRITRLRAEGRIDRLQNHSTRIVLQPITLHSIAWKKSRSNWTRPSTVTSGLVPSVIGWVHPLRYRPQYTGATTMYKPTPTLRSVAGKTLLPTRLA